jgi:leucyl aminopeptidase
MYCDDDAVADALLEAGTSAGDPLWRMPLWRPYRKELESNCADLNNVAKNSFGGSIVAAVYLAEFVTATPRWVQPRRLCLEHDIAAGSAGRRRSNGNARAIQVHSRALPVTARDLDQRDEFVHRLKAR